MPKVSSPEITDRSVGATVQEALRMTRRYVISYYQSRKDHAVFQNVKTYCMFVGHARSGGSILGALLDAHPNIVFGDEFDTLRYVAAGFTKDQIYQLILAKSLKQATKGRVKGGRDGKTYSYFVPGQWQGRFTNIQVVGDSKAGFSTQRFAQNPALLQRLRDTMQGVDIKIIHVFRNPFDTVSTMYLRSGRPLENGIARYFANCETIMRLREGLHRSDMLSVRHEDFVVQPELALRSMCRFLGVEAPDDYVQACVGILYQSPAKSRHKVQWSPELIDTVQRNINRFDFLEGYSFEQ